MSTVRGVFVSLLLVLNTFLWGSPIVILGLFKLLLSGRARLRVTTTALGFANGWVRNNNLIFDAFLPTTWDSHGIEGLRGGGHYLMLSNHVSWTDIFVLQRTFRGVAPFLRFFTKQEFIWFPIVGQACWALDFPFMKRYSREYLARHPEKRGQDLETTRRACRRYRDLPVTVLNFVEGTRFNLEKKQEQDSPYRYLLRPRVGGLAFVLASLGDLLEGVIDVTIAYPGESLSAWDFVCGRIPRITVRVRQFPVPPEFSSAAILEPGAERERFRDWIETIWSEKDALLAEMKSDSVSRSPA
jgi:1-acyl-sn-glycerol-3-phosphate acyltransferase